jgi:peptidoglycan/LPS O-acetylase OafA/YrhL
VSIISNGGNPASPRLEISHQRSPMNYNPALDGIRALSIVTVVLFHCSVPWSGGGFIGVDIFFVLSGYLITSLLAAEHRNGGIGIGAFYARRALRLYPTLLVLLLAYVALAPVLWPTENRWLAAAITGFYVTDYALPFWGMSFAVGHTWSLGVEEKFYLLWPLLLPLLLRTRHPIGWLLVAFTGVTIWRYFVALQWGWAQAYFCFDTRMSGILLGAIGALAGIRMSRLTALIACVTLAIIVCVPIIQTSTQGVSIEGVTLGITLAEICAFVLVSYVAEHANARFLASRPMVYLGRLSYGIYLWHFPFVLLLREVPSLPWWLTLSATLLFSVTMAAICLHGLDIPLRRWRERTRHARERGAPGFA